MPIKGCLLPTGKSTDLASKRVEEEIADQTENEEGSYSGSGQELRGHMNKQ